VQQNEPRTTDALTTPAALVDLDIMAANLDRMAAYAREHGLALRPHTKTHKSTRMAAEQLKRGAVGLTVATPLEAETMVAATDDVLLAHPPVGTPKIARVVALAERSRLTVALDSAASLDALAAAAAARGVQLGVLVELDLGMRRVGVATPADAVALARRAADARGLEYRGILFYPGHIRGPVAQHGAPLERLNEALAAHMAALRDAGLPPGVVSGGSTPTAFETHRVQGLTEFRPGTYIFNDRTTAAVDACAWQDCAYTVLATVVSTAVPGQAVVDAGSKALAREELRGADGGAGGFGALLDRPEVVVRTMSEEHGILDLGASSWQPKVGDQVRIVPNHVCVSVNLQRVVFGVRGEAVVTEWEVEARGWVGGPTAGATAG
jgi:D-serine deaminase-like pyridoxal phosphate-dependent protein